MPHVFVNRPRLHDLTDADASLRDHFRWETINAVVYKLGGVIFVIGSILFFPALEAYADLGVWTFILGSLLYLVVTGHDMLEVIHHARTRTGPATVWDRLDRLSAIAYLAGTLFFTGGSVFFLSAVGLLTSGAWCFVLGSLLFVLGATINVLQIVRAHSLLTLQLMNLTALSFVTGSVLFTVGSIPYLWTIDTAHDLQVIDTFLAWQFLVGSLLFLLGGVFNYWRAWIVIRQEIAAQQAGAG